ncbi:MAG: Asp-tRNA(Asn)/Glu-tRNA(Gln) amidotransferase subunit GatC [Candidatus Peribacteraceae bacterium]|nr:Asp-tRNA(Asn)/Glu-tRNA(Gln) amidotransferase subunit GatC [Candidatus Peribacteraceae bacterium]
MTQLTADQVRHIASLARLTLSEDEVKKFSKELTAILDYVDVLQKVDTKGIEPLKQVTGLASIYRDDVIARDTISTEAMLATSPLPVVSDQIETPSAHGER